MPTNVTSSLVQCQRPCPAIQVTPVKISPKTVQFLSLVSEQVTFQT